MSDDEALRKALREGHTRFAEKVAAIRPLLHRYCARMTGSVLDGEDLVQEALAQAFYGLSLSKEEIQLDRWLFTIAHHKCVDFLRARKTTTDVAELVDDATPIDDATEDRQLASQAFSGLVSSLPPRERACVILKDVLDYSLDEIAAILQTSAGAVKAALHRARSKRGEWIQPAAEHRAPSPEEIEYVDAFNRRDWTELQSMLEQEVRCELVGHVHLAGREAMTTSYLTTYGSLPYGWKLVFGDVDGEHAIVCLRQEGDRWTPRHAIRLEWKGDRVTRIRDYADVPYVFFEGRIRTEEETR